MPRSSSEKGLFARFDGPDRLRIIWNLGNPVGGRDWRSDRLRLLKRLLPHVHRSVLTRQALAAADALGSGLEGLLDNGRIGVVQLDHGGRVLGPTTWRWRSYAAATGSPTTTARSTPGCRPTTAACTSCWGARRRTRGARPGRRLDDGPAPLGPVAARVACEPGGKRGRGRPAAPLRPRRPSAPASAAFIFPNPGSRYLNF